MVGGWDKSPGPDNDYTGQPWTRAHFRLLSVILIVLISLVVAIVLV
jgi:hypothetical protein